MWKIASNLVLERQRQRANRARLDQTILFQPAETFCAPSPESLLYTEQQLKLVEEALNQLPPKCVEAFVLRIVEERSFQEVAGHMGVSERMAKLYVARAAQFCQSYLNAAEALERVGQ
jgi:RNA polymerase sigma-70 factor (ECF subfamily)